MKAKFIVLTVLLFTSSLYAQNPTFEWAKQIGGTEYAESVSMATDASGNLYLMGRFEDTVDFDPGADTTNLISEGFYDIFILKLDINGNFLWVNQIGGKNIEEGYSITTDVNGNVYASGGFQDTVDFDPGAGTSNLISNGKFDIFIQKLDTNGNLLWVMQMGGTGWDYAFSITTDANGNVYTTGKFQNTLDFDPGAGTAILTSTGSNSMFIQKLNTNGNFVWVKKCDGTGGNALGRSIVIDVNGNLCITGSFYGTVDFDPGSGTTLLTTVGNRDIFVQKLNVNGNLIWVKQIGGTDRDVALSITTDASGNLYITGYFTGTVDFDPGLGTKLLTSAGDEDVYVQKFDVNGNFLWVKRIGGMDNDIGYSITTDVNGNVYLTGSFSGMVDFDPGSGSKYFTASGIRDIFIQNLDSNGNLLFATHMGGIGISQGHSIIIDSYGNICTSGFFFGTADFDPGAGSANLTAAGNIDMFIQKMSMSSTTIGIKQNFYSNNFVVYPNPTNGKLSIKFERNIESLTVRILSISGQEIKRERFQNTNIIKMEINQPNGIYILEMSDDQDNKATLRLLKH